MISDVRDAVIDHLAAAGFGDAVEPHPGRLSLPDLTTFVVRGRAAVRVALLGVPTVTLGAVGPEYTLALAAYVMCLDRQGLPRDAAAMNLAFAVAGHVTGNTWGRDDLDSPEQIRADNLYAGTVDKRGVAVWAVVWRQVWTPYPITADSLDDLLRVVTDFDINTDTDGEPVLVDTVELYGGNP